MNMDYFLNRLREPSTWVGLAALGGALGISPDLITLTGQVVMAVGGIAGILLAEQKS